jgi:cytochrome P450
VTRPLETFSPFDPVVLSDPLEFWAALREQAPVHRFELPGSARPVYFVSRRDDIKTVAMDPQTYSSESPSDIWRWGDLGPELQPRLLEQGWSIVHTIASADPPRHTVYRKLVNAMFLPNKVRAMLPELQSWTDDLANALPRNEPFDFMERFAVPLPIGMIAGMLGLPMEDRPLIQRYTDAFVKMVDPSSQGAEAQEHLRVFAEGQHYLNGHMEARQSRPDGSILSAIANARDEDGAPLSQEEKLSMGYIMLAAGNETTRNAIAISAWHLARSPDLFAELKAGPEAIPAFIEETLRLGSPARLNPRYVTRDTELAGVRIEAGAVVFILWGSANRDESSFEAPDEICLHRPSPRNHQAFGYGLHSCVGAPLARQELLISMQSLMSRFDRWEFAVPAEDISPLPLFGFRTFGTLPIRAG